MMETTVLVFLFGAVFIFYVLFRNAGSFLSSTSKASDYLDVSQDFSGNPEELGTGGTLFEIEMKNNQEYSVSSSAQLLPKLSNGNALLVSKLRCR